MQVGDENLKKFQQFARDRREINTIWSMENESREKATNFRELAKTGTQHFRSLFQATREAPLVEIVRVA